MRVVAGGALPPGERSMAEGEALLFALVAVTGQAQVADRHLEQRWSRFGLRRVWMGPMAGRALAISKGWMGAHFAKLLLLLAMALQAGRLHRPVDVGIAGHRARQGVASGAIDIGAKLAGRHLVDIHTWRRDRWSCDQPVR